jgi:hypothetical protein
LRIHIKLIQALHWPGIWVLVSSIFKFSPTLQAMIEMSLKISLHPSLLEGIIYNNYCSFSNFITNPILLIETRAEVPGY